ncbi:MAG: histidinol-phosphatase HisJ family protein [Clostridiales bacterium]|nr:histidinol-phosphatase HisJ family protein [Clostridiales bacterium]
MIISDFHTHTYFSSDSKSDPEDMIKAAIQLGLKKYCFTDHMDYKYPHPDFGPFVFDPEEYFKTLLVLKEKYKDQIEIMIGIELGLRNEPDLKDEIYDHYKKLTEKYPFDFVIGSTHVLDHYDPYLKDYWKTRTGNDGIREYFQSIALNAKFYDMFQIYGHLDYIVRYIPDDIKQYHVADYKDEIDQMLTSIIENGKGIECNTSGYKYGLGVTHPKKEVLKRYRELGGELITIGSDGHKPEHIAYDFHKAEELLKELGFQYYAVYKERKPEFIKL